MTAPANTRYVNGQTPVSGDQFNTFMQSASTVPTLRTFTGTVGMEVFLQGISAPGDGGAGAFWWNAASTAPDDGVNIIVPTGAVTGAWIRLSTVVNITGFANQLIAPIGQGGTTAYTGTNVSITTSHPLNAEFASSVQMTNNDGAGISVPLSTNKVAGYFATETKTGGGNGWAVNGLLEIDSGAAAIGGQQVVEWDLLNISGTNFGDAAGFVGCEQPAIFGEQISAGGSNNGRASAAIIVLGNIGGTNPAWNRGLVAGPLTISRGFLEDYSNAIRSYMIQGSHTYGIDSYGDSSTPAAFSGAFLRMNSQDKIVARNAGNSADLTLLQTDSSNNLRVGNTTGLTEVVGGLSHLGTTLGFYSATPVTKPTVTGSKGANAALTSLMSALSTLGLVVDSTT